MSAQCQQTTLCHKNSFFGLTQPLSTLLSQMIFFAILLFLAYLNVKFDHLLRDLLKFQAKKQIVDEGPTKMTMESLRKDSGEPLIWFGDYQRKEVQNERVVFYSNSGEMPQREKKNISIERGTLKWPADPY